MTKVQEFLKVAESLTEEMEGRMIARAFHSELDKIAAENEDTGPGLGTALLAGGGAYGAYKGFQHANRKARMLGLLKGRGQARALAASAAGKMEAGHRAELGNIYTAQKAKQKQVGQEFGKALGAHRKALATEKTLAEGYRAQAPEAVRRAVQSVSTKLKERSRGEVQDITAKLKARAKGAVGQTVSSLRGKLIRASKPLQGIRTGAASRRRLIRQVFGR
jgi:hypothetical protein